jgi:hypothetical protein
VERTDHLVATLHDVTLAYQSEGTAEERLSATGVFLEPEAERILEECEAHQATAGRNYLPFLSASTRINERPFSASWKAWS